ILSDAASVIMASLGMPPSAELQAEDGAGDPNMTTCTGMYQPVHGSVPHRKGKDMVNPCATILSAAMLLRHSFNMDREARAVEDGVEAVLAKGYRTYDVMEEGCTLVGTARMGDLVAEEVAAGRS
ncbi:MAG: 3-isopropylmalate dehydrogenase, partial [Chloroflexi bacterium]|nr:3-isopropylmalate dehydrogenase [Chloroflexota bacterium]